MGLFAVFFISNCSLLFYSFLIVPFFLFVWQREGDFEGSTEQSSQLHVAAWHCSVLYTNWCLTASMQYLCGKWAVAGKEKKCIFFCFPLFLQFNKEKWHWQNTKHLKGSNLHFFYQHMATPVRQKLGWLGVVHQTIGICSAFPSFVQVHSIHLSMVSVISFLHLLSVFFILVFMFCYVFLFR